MRINGRRVVQAVSLLLAAGSLARVVVLFLESVAAVREERAHDTELLKLCVEGHARGSTKMRTACLQARSDLASPVLLKGLLRAFSTAYAEFIDSVSTPAKLALFLLFVMSSIFLPINSWMKIISSETAQSTDAQSHVVLLGHGSGHKRSRLKSKFARALRLKGPEPQIDISELSLPNTCIELGHQKYD